MDFNKALASGGLQINSEPGLIYTSGPRNVTTSNIGIPYNSSNDTQSTPTYVDPYAKWGGKSAFDNLTSGFNTQKQNIFNTANDAASQGARNLKSSILDFLDMYKSGQGKIDLAGTHNELAKRQGASSIMGMVGRGIRSGGVTLANKNASDSSASGAIARAYGDIGSREMRKIGNQYELKNDEIGLQQEELGSQVRNYERDYEDEKISTVNAITADARDKLAALDADMLNADMPERIAIEQEKAKIKAQALSKLSQYDAYLRTERGKIKPISADERRRRAAGLQTEGYDLGEGAFDFTDEAPAQLQGTGPFPSDLPIFTMPRARREG